MLKSSKIKQQLQLPEKAQEIYENLYFHIPFCQNKCAYCAFFSITDFDEKLTKKYINYLIEQIKVVKYYCKPLHSIYIGGGTPTLLNENQLTHFLSAIHKYLPLSKNCEISIESNPETLNEEKVTIVAKYCNRLSLGVQSFDKKIREIIGRKCRDKAVENALKLIKSSSLKSNFNIDLIYGIPSQNLKMWQIDLENAIKQETSHISCYALTIDEGAKLAEENAIKNNINDDFAVECSKLTRSYLTQNNIIQYEISNYAKTNKKCQHNLNIWYGESYLGIGTTASSFNSKKNERFTQVDNVTDYLKGHAPEVDIIEEKDRLLEIFIIGLRTTNGWKKHQWEKVIENNQHHKDILNWSNLCNYFYNNLSTNNLNIYFSKNYDTNFCEESYDAIITKDNIRLTTQGLNFWDEIAVAML